MIVNNRLYCKVKWKQQKYVSVESYRDVSTHSGARRRLGETGRYSCGNKQPYDEAKYRQVDALEQVAVQQNKR